MSFRSFVKAQVGLMKHIASLLHHSVQEWHRTFNVPYLCLGCSEVSEAVGLSRQGCHFTLEAISCVESWNQQSPRSLPVNPPVLCSQVQVRGAFLLLMEIVRLLGLAETNLASEQEQLLLRLLVPVAKLYTGKQVWNRLVSPECGMLASTELERGVSDSSESRGYLQDLQQFLLWRLLLLQVLSQCHSGFISICSSCR